MERRTILLGLLVFLFISVNCEPRKRGGGGSLFGGWGSKKSNSRGTSRPASRPATNTQTQTHGSQPGKIGWNVPPRNNPPPKPSAPVQDHVSKSSATQVHSGYPNTQQQNYGQTQSHNHQGRPPPYSPPGSYPSGHSSMGYGGNPGGYGGGYNQPYGGGHGYGNMGHGFSSHPGSGYNPSVGNPQPVILQSKPYKPGIGQIAKEAFVFAGVNAAVNRIIPGGIYGNGGSVWGGNSHSGGAAAGAVPGVTNTHITYNNYYNNGTSTDGTAPQTNGQVAPMMQGEVQNPAPPVQNAAPPAGDNPAPPPPQQQDLQNIPSPSGYIITNDDLQKLSEDLYSKEKNNAYKDINMNLQGHKMDDSTTDDASAPLLTVKSEVYEIPTVKNVVALLDNYELDVKTKEVVTSEERKEENELLDAFLATDVMQSAMKYLASKGYLADDEYEFKDSLKRIWFSQFKRIDGEPSSSGFETVFLAEQFDSEIIGLHNWIYFAKQEEANKLNYLGYVKKADLGKNGAIVKLRLKLNDVLQPLSTVFIGTSPELEMALYTLCFYIRPNAPCPVSLGETKFLIVANRVNYFGKDLLVSAYPDI